MELKVYRSKSPVGGPGGGTRRGRGTEHRVHGTNGRGPRRARDRGGDVRLPLHERRQERARQGAGARAGLARRDRARAHRDARAAVVHRRQVDGRTDRVARRLAGLSTVLPGLVFLGYPLHPPGSPSSAATRTCRRSREPMLFVQGSRDAFGTSDEIRALLPTLQRATLHEIPGGDHSFKVSGRGAPKPDVVLTDPRRGYGLDRQATSGSSRRAVQGSTRPSESEAYAQPLRRLL